MEEESVVGIYITIGRNVEKALASSGKVTNIRQKRITPLVNSSSEKLIQKKNVQEVHEQKLKTQLDKHRKDIEKKYCSSSVNHSYVFPRYYVADNFLKITNSNTDCIFL